MAYKMKGFSGFKSSPVKQKVDPDAPGTPGTPGFEPPVKREDLDEKGKAIWDRLRLAKKNTPIQIEREKKKVKKKKSPAKQKGPIDKKNLKLQKGEYDGTSVYEGKDRNERINDLEDRAGFLINNDITNDGSKKDNQRKKAAKKLQHEADILRNRKPKKKK